MAKLRYAHVLGDTLSETLSLGNSENYTTLTQAQLDELLKLRENIYTIEEIDRIIGGISTVNFEIVDELPGVGKNSTIYLVPSGDDKNIYNEYIFIDSKWEPLGSTQIDVDNFIPISGTDKLNGNIIPETNNAIDLGSSNYKFSNIYGTTFHGSLDGNAATATKASQDGDGKTISSTYLKLGGGTMTGNLTLDSSANAYLNGSVFLGNTSMPYILSTTKGKVGMRAYTEEGATGKPAGQFAVSYDENYDGYFANIQARCDDTTGELHTLRVSHLGPTYHINKDDGYSEIHNLSFDDTVVHLSGNETINGNKIFTNKPAVKAASNELPAEYQEVEYIESTGQQFIKTGVVASSNDFRVKIKFMYPRAHASLSLFGSSTGAPFSMTVYGGRPTFYVGGSGGLDCGYQTEIGRVHVLDAHAKPEGILNINWDGNAYSIAYSGDLNKSNEFFIFGANSGGNLAESDQGYMLYYMEVYDNGVMVRKLIPCYRKSDSAIGLYDKVNDTFYENAGSGVFAKGSNVDYSLVQVATVDEIPTDYVDLTSDNQVISGSKIFSKDISLNGNIYFTGDNINIASSDTNPYSYIWIGDGFINMRGNGTEFCINKGQISYKGKSEDYSSLVPFIKEYTDEDSHIVRRKMILNNSTNNSIVYTLPYDGAEFAAVSDLSKRFNYKVLSGVDISNIGMIDLYNDLCTEFNTDSPYCILDISGRYTYRGLISIVSYTDTVLHVTWLDLNNLTSTSSTNDMFSQTLYDVIKGAGNMFVPTSGGTISYGTLTVEDDYMKSELKPDGLSVSYADSEVANINLCDDGSVYINYDSDMGFQNINGDISYYLPSQAEVEDLTDGSYTNYIAFKDGDDECIPFYDGCGIKSEPQTYLDSEDRATIYTNKFLFADGGLPTFYYGYGTASRKIKIESETLSGQHVDYTVKLPEREGTIALLEDLNSIGGGSTIQILTWEDDD